MRTLCFGEVLWDVMPGRRFLGGAPLNVAYHLAKLGCESALVSSVGYDELGAEALRLIAARGIDTHAIAQNSMLPTGTAEVQLDSTGQARFEIKQRVAWDDIPVDAAIGLPPPDVIVFGTLALRSLGNRIALTQVLNAFPRALVVCDLNLRAPFDDLTPLAPLLGRVGLIKLNADEARRLCGRRSTDSDWQEMAAKLSERNHGATICITMGADGAGLRQGNSWFHAEAPSIVVRDTVGAGDAFTAALVAGRLRCPAAQRNWSRILRTACALGGFVASRDGAQPDYDGTSIEW